MSFDTEVTTDAPRMWFKLDNASGTATNSGSVASPTITEGSSGATKGVAGKDNVRYGDLAYDFNGGANAYIQVTDTGGSGQDFGKNWTVEAVFKWDGAIGGSWFALGALKDNSGVSRTSFGVTNTGFIFVDSQFNGLNYSASALSNADTVWQHLVVTQTQDGASNVILRIYLNGSLVTTSASNTYSATNAVGRKFVIGWDASIGYNGPVSEWAAYSTALSGARVTAHYNAGFKDMNMPATPMTASALMTDMTSRYEKAVRADAGLWGFYELKESSGDYLNKPDLAGTSITVAAGGTRNVAAVNSVNSYADAWQHPNLNGNHLQLVNIGATLSSVSWTLECWFNPGNSSAARPEIFSGTGIPIYAYIIDSGGDAGKLRVQYGGLNVVTSSASVMDSWHHFAMTRSGSANPTVYLDGVSLGQMTGTITDDWVSTDDMFIGSAGFDGAVNHKVSSISVYVGAALSGTRIAAHNSAMRDGLYTVSPMTATGEMPNAVGAGQVNNNYNAQVATASGLMVDPFIPTNAGYTSQTLTATALMTDPTVFPGQGVNYTSSAKTASGVMVDADVDTSGNIAYNAQVMTASGLMPNVAVPNFNYNAEVMTASATAPSPTVFIGTAANYNATPMTATGQMRQNAEVGNVRQHAYYRQIRAQVDADDLWIPFLDTGGTKVTEEVSEIFNLGTFGRTEAKYFGGPILDVAGPNELKAARFDGEDDYAIVGSATDVTPTRTYCYEFLIKTAKKNQAIVSGTEEGAGTFYGSAIELRDGKVFLRRYITWAFGAYWQDILIGNEDIADNEWHHVVVTNWWFQADRANDYTQGTRDSISVWVDGKLDTRRDMAQMPGNTADRMARPDIVGKPVDAAVGYFEGDISMLVARRGYQLSKYEIEQNYYVAMGINPVRVTPTTVVATMPNARGKGNSTRVLNVYLRNLQSNVVGVGQFKTYYDTTNGRLVTSTIAWTDPNDPFGYRDAISNERRLINFQTDIDLANYDIINVIDGTTWTGGTTSAATQKTEDYLAGALNTSRGRAAQLLDDFYASLKQAVVVGGISLFIRQPEIAKRMGLIGNYLARKVSREKSLAAIGKPFWGQLGAGLSDEYDYWAWRNNPWGSYPATPNTPAWNNDNEYQYSDNHFINGERIVATEAGLTNMPGATMAEWIERVYPDPFTRGGGETAIRYDMNLSGLQIGQEMMYQTRIYGDKNTSAAKNLDENLPIYSVPSENVYYGTIIAKEMANDWVGNQRPSNPYADYATTIIIKEGDIVDGIESQGRIAISFNNDIASPDKVSIGIPHPAEPEAKKKWQTSTYRGGGGYLAVDLNGNVVGGTNPVDPNQTPPGDTNTRPSNVVYIFQPTEQPSYMEVNGDMGRRIFKWLAVNADLPGDNDAVVQTEAMTAYAQINSPTTTGSVNLVVRASTAYGSATMLDSTDKDSAVNALPMTASAVMNSNEKRISVEPMTASALMLDNFDELFANGKAIDLVFSRTVNKTIVVYLRSDNL
jgi:hypothetical protein